MIHTVKWYDGIRVAITVARGWRGDCPQLLAIGSSSSTSSYQPLPCPGLHVHTVYIVGGVVDCCIHAWRLAESSYQFPYTSKRRRSCLVIFLGPRCIESKDWHIFLNSRSLPYVDMRRKYWIFLWMSREYLDCLCLVDD